MKETMKKEDVIEILRELQMDTAKCNGLFAGHVSQSWVIEKLGEKIIELGGSPYIVKKNKVIDTKE